MSPKKNCYSREGEADWKEEELGGSTKTLDSSPGKSSQSVSRPPITMICEAKSLPK